MDDNDTVIRVTGAESSAYLVDTYMTQINLRLAF